MGGKNRKKVKSTQLKKGKVEDNEKCSKPPLQVEDKGDKENDQDAEVSSQGDLPAVEKTMTALHLDEQTETKIDELKNNNATPPIKYQPQEAQESLAAETAKTSEAPKIFFSSGLDRKKSLSNLEISSPPSEKKEPPVVQKEQDPVNYNNNIAQKGPADDQQEEGIEKPKILAPMKHPLEHSWTLW